MTQHHIPEALNLWQYHCENPNSHSVRVLHLFHLFWFVHDFVLTVGLVYTFMSRKQIMIRQKLRRCWVIGELIFLQPNINSSSTTMNWLLVVSNCYGGLISNIEKIQELLSITNLRCHKVAKITVICSICCLTGYFVFLMGLLVLPAKCWD
jgi:hypothetical protein